MRRERDETTPKQETGMSDQDGMRDALAEFVGDIKRMHAGIETRLDKQEKTMSLIQAKSAARGRPALSAEPADAPHRKAFDAYVRTGADDALRAIEVEGKSMTTVASDGGYLVDPQTSEQVRGVLTSTASIRAIATVVNVEASSFDVLVDHGTRGYGWSTESDLRAEEDTAQVARIKIPLHELAALPKASQRLLDDAAFDVEGWLASRIAETFARAEADAFVNGDGIDKPKGFLTGTPVPEELWEWGQLGYVPTGQAAGFDDPDALVDLVLRARRALPRGRVLRDELQDRRARAQAQGRRRALPVVGRARGRRARAAAGLPGAGRRGHARGPARGASRSPSATSPPATPSPSAPTCASCAIRSRRSPTSSSTPPSAWAAT